MAKKNVSRWTQEELNARNALRKQRKANFESKLPELLNVGNEVFDKDHKAHILRVLYNLGQDLTMQIENLRDVDGTLRQVKENHLTAIKNLMDAVIQRKAEGEFHTRSASTSVVDEFFN